MNCAPRVRSCHHDDERLMVLLWETSTSFVSPEASLAAMATSLP